MDIPIFNIDDLVVPPEKLQTQKRFRRAVIRKPHEIIIEKGESEILERDLKQSKLFGKSAKQLIQFYLDADASINYIAQDLYIKKYLNGEFVLPWLIPIVRDLKLVYKRKYDGTYTESHDQSYIKEVHRNILNYANIDSDQIIIDYLRNYRAIPPTNLTNKNGAHVLRIKENLDRVEEGEDIKDSDLHDKLQFRGSIGNHQTVELEERTKSAKKTVITGKTMVDDIKGEDLNVVGFAGLPLNYPSRDILDAWYENTEIAINPDKLETLLHEFIPNVGRLLDMYNTVGITDLRAYLRLFEIYGHRVQSLTEMNKVQLAGLIKQNIDDMRYIRYTKTDRLEYFYVEKELIGDKGSGILSPEVMAHPAMLEYNIPFENYPNIFHRYLKIVGRIDNGNIWTTLIDEDSSPQDIENAVQHYRIINRNLEISRDLEKSYANLLNQTMPDMELLNDMRDNPLDNIVELREDRRDKIAWYSYFKKARLDRFEQNWYYFNKWLGCAHEYDRLYQKFEDANDPYPLGKRYTRITPNDGVICGFCGTTLRSEDELVDQGYDARGQKINTYDNDALLRRETNIDLFFKKDKSEVVRSGEKLVEQWLEISGRNLTSRQRKAVKYEVLRVYEEKIMENKFFYGLQQNPNKLVNVKKIPFGEFLVQKYKIEKPQSFPNYLFLLKLFSFFYSLSSVYEIIMQRLAVFLVINNAYMIQKDPIYLNINVMLSLYNLEKIGEVFFNFNLKEKSLIQGLAEDSTRKKKREDGFFDLFAEKASKVYPKKGMTTIAYTNMLRQEYQKYRILFLYTPNENGYIFDGNNSLEHEIMRIFDEYLVSQGRPKSLDYLKEHTQKCWNEWKENNDTRVQAVEDNARIAIIPQRNVLVNPPRGVRPLYDRYLAQRKFILQRKLEQTFVDLINENIHNIELDKNRRQLGTGQTGGGGGNCPSIPWGSLEPAKLGACGSSGDLGAIIIKKMYLLNKLNCEDWQNLEELDLIGLAEETANLELITRYKEQIAIIDNQMEAGGMMKLYWVKSGGYLIPDLRSRYYKYFHSYPPIIDLMKIENGKVSYRKLKAPEIPHRVTPRIDDEDLPSISKMYRDLSFLDRISRMLEFFGRITYLDDVENFSCHIYQVINGQMNGVTRCNSVGVIQPPYPKPDEFKNEFKEYMKNMYMDTKVQMLNIKKYIITNLRQRVYLMSRITERKQMIQHGLEEYLDLFEYEEFNQAFQNFNKEKELGRIFTNDEIENLVVNSMNDYKKHSTIINNLKQIFVSDIVRHLRLVKTRTGRFVKGKKTVVKKDDEPNASDIFIMFVKILINEIRSQEVSSNVDFYHLQINQMFRSKNFWKKMNQAEKKGEIEYKILKHQLSVAEIEEDLGEAGGGEQALLTEKALEAEDEYEALDMENDEDDYNDNDFDNL